MLSVDMASLVLSAVIAFCGGSVWLTAMWIRVGRILERLDQIAERGRSIEGRICDMERRVVCIEGAATSKRWGPGSVAADGE